MVLIDQHTKAIMEGCKERARGAGLRFSDETLEYVVSNRDLLELSPKVMIPTLYDYWVHEVEVLKERGRYELYPSNPYETVLNTRPPISFYNSDNPDWLNVMIFYHVLGHIDFFQNNIYFQHTWGDDFTGQALADKRFIAHQRSEHGRWVDYTIEFTRAIDNLVGYYQVLSRTNSVLDANLKRDYYFDVFLQEVLKVSISKYIEEIERYNRCMKEHGDRGESMFFIDVHQKHPEFKQQMKDFFDNEDRYKPTDLIEYIIRNSRFLNKKEHGKEINGWMKAVMRIVRNTSIYFQPQIRTKILNEGWASYWHEQLFLQDDRIKGHEVDFARVNAGVTSLSRVGLNPYAIGMRLFKFIKEWVDKGKYSFEFDLLHDEVLRRQFDQATGQGRDFIFTVRERYSDFMFINSFLNQDFVNRYELFVVGKRLNLAKQVYEYYVKSRKAEAYRQMIFDKLYHPPFIEVDEERTKDGFLYLVHQFEGKPLVKEYIANTMLGIEYLWGGPVFLDTHEVTAVKMPEGEGDGNPPEVKWQSVTYTMKERRLTKQINKG